MERVNSVIQTATAIVKFVGSDKEYEYFVTKSIFESDFDKPNRYFKITNEKNYTYGTPVQFIRYNFKPTAMAQRTIVAAVEMVKDGRFSNGFIDKATYDREKALEKSQVIRETINTNKEKKKFEIADICFNLGSESWDTIVYWKDGEATSITCRGEVDRDAGIALCFMKKATGEKFISILNEYGED